VDIVQAIQTRKSIRDFKPDPVSKTILKEILAAATRAPSAENSQPWEFTIVAGDVLDAVKRKNIEKGIAYPVSIFGFSIFLINTFHAESKPVSFQG